MLRPLRRLAVLSSLAGATAALLPGAAAAVALPTDFAIQDVTPGASWNTPVAIAYLPGGRMLVAEKRGRVFSVVNGVRNSTPMIQLDDEVLNTGDRGLLGLAVDPNYLSNHHVYLLYTVDPDSNGTDNNDDAFARLTRYTVSFADSNVFDPASRTILMGAGWTDGPVSCSESHTIGTLRFGEDGSLLVGAGDGASFSYMDAGGQDPNAFLPGRTNPYEDIGAFRAQSLTSLAGKILRIDPANGLGYSSNPYWDGNPASVRSRVWAYGLRNPFRFCIRPGTGDPNPANGNPGIVTIGDVGWTRWEDLHIVTEPGANFGWPCYEGIGPRSEYQSASPAHNGCGSFGTADNPAFPTAPVSTWHHTEAGLSVPPGFVGNTSVGGVWYTGTLYPSEYRNKYFHADYGANWVQIFDLDPNYDLISVSLFGSLMDGPVDLELEPGTKNIVYVSINTNQIRRIVYTGAPPAGPPIAAASATPQNGEVPLAVQFSSAGSFDPEGGALSYAWDFGDGGSSTAPDPSHTYTVAGSYDAVLSLGDDEGLTGRDTVRVTVTPAGGFPTAGVLDAFNRANGPIGTPWTGITTGLNVSGNRLSSTGAPASAVWNGAVFGPDQEAYLTFNTVTAAAPEHDLMLKVQGTSYTAGHIEVRYTAPAGEVQVSTYTQATQWVNRGGPIAVTFAAGDRFGARALSNGVIEVYKNATKIGETTCGDWPYATLGGRLGLTFAGASASLMDDFGGGDVVFTTNTAPEAVILSPLANSVFAVGTLIELHATAVDAEDPPAAIQYHWEVDLHHNTHVHPATVVADLDTATFLGQNHDDGTGIWLQVRLRVTDPGGLTDTTSVNLYPEIDLAPGLVTTSPSTPGTTAPATWRFWLHNRGRMPAPLHHWRLLAGTTTLAEGDTLVPPLDSVLVLCTLAPALAAGSWTVRAVADSANTVFETDETNNASARALEVVPGDGPDEVPPRFASGPAVTPTSADARFAWTTDEPSTGVIRYGPSAALGDSIAASGPWLAHAVMLGGLAPATRYHFVVVALDTLGNRSASAPDSFTTLGAPVAVEEAPARLALSAPRPNPSAGTVRFGLELPRDARIRFAILDLQGREVWSDGEEPRSAGRWTLEWNGTRASGERAPAGLYFARIDIGGTTLIRRIARLR